jgi:hypothetical protein
MGFLRVTAQGIRYAKSKSRYAMQELSFIECELVRGKESWRMTKARPIESAFSTLPPDASKAIARVARLASRLCDEDATSAPYMAIRTMADALAAGCETDIAEISATASILASLGYLDDNDFPFLHHDSFKNQDAVREKRTELVKAINIAIKAATS